jgi:ribonuclease J
VRRVVNALARQGIEVLTDRMLPVHCSGHASAEEQAELIDIVRPKHFVPIHGERAMLEAHARTAIRSGVAAARIHIIENGESLILEGGSMVRGPNEAVSRRALDGEGRALDWGDVKDRIRISKNGLVVCSVAVDRATGRLLDRPMFTSRGMSLSGSVVTVLEDAVSEALRGARMLDGSDRDTLTKSAIRNVLRAEAISYAEVAVHVLAVGAPAGQ